ncbi:hypothetical protein SERLA73DRAFT_144746, partial [Serpula lacrymans var. lacrymans S7.3]
PRAITRNVSSDAAQSLRNRGAEVVEADLFDTESIKVALDGCECVFGVTDYMDSKMLAKGREAEVEVGKALVDAAVEAGVRFFVWSSLPNCTKRSGGKYTNIFQFDSSCFIFRPCQLTNRIPA